MTINVRAEGLDLRTVADRAKGAGREVEAGLRRELRSVAEPIVADARSRMAALPGTGPRTAKTIRATAGTSQVAVSLGGKAVPFALGREFGSNKTKDSRGRAIPYGWPAIFGPWTGNRFTLEPGQVSGRAFTPAVHDGMVALGERLDALVERQLGALA